MTSIGTAIGQVFTPVDAAKRIASEHGVLEAWLRGATVLDPTAGDGSFLEALIELALERGIARARLPVQRLYAVERDEALLASFASRMRARFSLRLPDANLRAHDLFTLQDPPQADVLMGNPPWVNYVDLPETERARLRPLFHSCGLIRDPRRLLLGGSRIDLAALVIAWSIRHLLRHGGKAVFLAPLSLYLNDGAHEGFRRHVVDGVRYALREVWDHRGAPIFPGVATRYGLVTYERDAAARWPVPWREFAEDRWITQQAAPCGGEDGPLVVHDLGANAPTAKVTVQSDPDRAAWRPRQGVNTCGATDLFVFDRCTAEGVMVVAENKVLGQVRLPRRYVLPLMTAETLRSGNRTPHRWILIPHDPVTGRPLERDAIDAMPDLALHLDAHAVRLRMRKGTMLGTHLRRGHWWALLGVGPYSYAPWRVAWEAFGRSTFRPALLDATDDGPWQGNQALHAYIPVRDRAQGERVLRALAPEVIEPQLRAHRMEGTCNWAQPGRIARILALTMPVRWTLPLARVRTAG
ncbi:MAG: hypothetical protein HY905_01005 [Deltaproteobacteria bacterium]|nr:hypothetical protein [Deltaproteobacteria bacterium]